MTTVTALLTAAEFAELPSTGPRTELVRGRIIELPPTNFLHGLICGQMAFQLMVVAKHHDSGRVITNDSGVVTERDPDTLRGPDVAYYRNAKIPPIEKRQGYPDQPPDLVVEVRSPSDRWSEMLRKATEYLAVGVLVVVVLDPETRSAHSFQADQPERVFGPDEMLTFPDLLPDFAVRVGSIFE